VCNANYLSAIGGSKFKIEEKAKPTTYNTMAGKAEARENVMFRTDIRTKDGESIPFQFKASVIRDNEPPTLILGLNTLEKMGAEMNTATGEIKIRVKQGIKTIQAKKHPGKLWYIELDNIRKPEEPYKQVERSHCFNTAVRRSPRLAGIQTSNRFDLLQQPGNERSPRTAGGNGCQPEPRKAVRFNPVVRRRVIWVPKREGGHRE
jgi:hypothetical protein